MKPTDLVVTRLGSRFLGRHIPCSIGRSGFARKKREGDGSTPCQNMRLVGGGFRKSRVHKPNVPFEMKAIGPAHVWSDDEQDPSYNHIINNRYHKFSHESLYRSDPLYDVVLYTDYNYPHAISGAGSAIFVHQWRKARHPTEGCIAFSRADLKWILARWTVRSRIIVKAQL